MRQFKYDFFVQAIILKYEEYLGSDCGGEGTMLEGEDEDKIILSLKGLRNIGNTLRYVTHG
jgi:hypothetical protein